MSCQSYTAALVQYENEHKAQNQTFEFAARESTTQASSRSATTFVKSNSETDERQKLELGSRMSFHEQSPYTYIKLTALLSDRK